MLKYAERPSEKALFRENFVSADYIKDNGGTINNSPIISNGITLDGTNQNVTYGESYNGVKTVSIRLKATTTSEDILDLDGGTHTIEVSAGTITATGFAAPTIYVDGVVTSTLDTNEHVITVTTATAFNATALDIGHETTYFDGTIYEVSLYSEVYTLDEILDKYQNDTFREIDASKALVCLPLRSHYETGGVEVTENIGSLGGTATLGDGTTSSTFPTQLTPKGMSFDGTTDYIDLGSDTIGTGVATFLVVFKATGWGEGASGRLFDNGKTLGFVDSSARFRFSSDGAGAEAATANGSLSLGRPYVIVVTRNASNNSDIWVNGARLIADDSSGTPIAGTSNVIIGNRAATDRTFDGNIYMYCHYNSILTPTQIRELSTQALNNLNI